jgi:septum formation protein
MQLILASTSPYRADLLKRLGLKFERVAPRTDETPTVGEVPAALALRLSVAKAAAVAALYPTSMVIGSDQVADLDGEPLGKPGHRDAAIAQLLRLAGRTLTFHTAVAVATDGGARIERTSVPTTVQFRALSRRMIESYVDREPAFDCAGSAKCEGLGIALMRRVSSEDPTAIIGLPLMALTSLLGRFGVDVLAGGEA